MNIRENNNIFKRYIDKNVSKQEQEQEDLKGKGDLYIHIPPGPTTGHTPTTSENIFPVYESEIVRKNYVNTIDLGQPGSNVLDNIFGSDTQTTVGFHTTDMAGDKATDHELDRAHTYVDAKHWDLFAYHMVGKEEQPRLARKVKMWLQEYNK